ncbi:Sporulation-specific protein 5 [Cladobotryum mycophilum]|uniref:Sporulation-specific protein 5 n=1 Tax=Cladobotryum mycophilum TaxID=491253 RepID=A0ABR0T2K3_9HYPO
MDSNSGVAGPYLPTPAGRGAHGHASAHGAADPSALMNHFTGMTLGGLGMSNNNGTVPMGHGHAFVLGSDGQLVLAPMPGGQQIGLGHSNENPYHNFSVPPGGYGAPYVGLPMPLMPFTPGRSNSTQPRLDRLSDVPGLENRRGSYSTTESTPATPFYAAFSHRDTGPRVASLDRSSYTTPSPQQMGLPPFEPVKPAPVVVSDRQMKSLEQSMENRIPGNRNVYIRGLHPTTDDELLYQFAARFGGVETSKAIIDTATGACKGFGFAKFFDSRDSEMCIRGFHRLGYEVGFARESFNSRLKAEGDELSTNLYISNLPKTLTEVELSTIFLGYTIQSSKILRDSMGNSRGVGFARFENRDVCDDIIRKFNGIGIGEEGLQMNIRYADTPAQKELKRVTAERRQFRTNEYNIGAYGTPLVGMSPTLYDQQSQWRRTLPPSRSGLSTSSIDDGNVMRTSVAHRGQSETVASTSTDATISTPTSSECDEGVTIHADPNVVVAVGNENLQSSPSIKKEVKKESQ